MTFYPPLPDEARETLASLKLPTGNSAATLSDLGWAVRIDAQAILHRHARALAVWPKGPVDLAIQLAATRLAAGGLLALADSGPLGTIATWYATRIVEVLLGQPPRFERAPGELDLRATILLGHGDLQTAYRFEDNGHLVPFDPPD